MTGALLLFAAIAGAAASPDVAEGRGLATNAQAPAAGVRIDAGGEVSVLADWLPRRDVRELRPRVRLDVTVEPARWVRLYAEVLAEGLVADRALGDGIRDGFGQLREGWVELVANRADLRAGRGRLAWGRLDEVQPSDVINPLDAAKYLFEGRTEARRPVTFVRGRVYPIDGFSIEGVVVPRFERGVFDELDEPTSPFNLLNDLVLPAGAAVSGGAIERREPDVSWSKPLGGVRVAATAGRVDLAFSAFEGADGFGVVETFPRFRMYAADFETVAGQWAIRGEVASFVDKQLAGVTVPGAVSGQALDAGIGFDRRAGDFRVYGTALYHREWSPEDPGVERSSFSLVGSIERSLARETHLVRTFAVVNPGDQSAFLRGLWVWNFADNTALEVSAGAFLGTSDDAIGRFHGRDFLFTRLKWSF